MPHAGLQRGRISWFGRTATTDASQSPQDLREGSFRPEHLPADAAPVNPGDIMLPTMHIIDADTSGGVGIPFFEVPSVRIWRPAIPQTERTSVGTNEALASDHNGI